MSPSSARKLKLRYMAKQRRKLRRRRRREDAWLRDYMARMEPIPSPIPAPVSVPRFCYWEATDSEPEIQIPAEDSVAVDVESESNTEPVPMPAPDYGPLGSAQWKSNINTEIARMDVAKPVAEPVARTGPIGLYNHQFQLPIGYSRKRGKK